MFCKSHTDCRVELGLETSKVAGRYLKGGAIRTIQREGSSLPRKWQQGGVT